MGSGKSHIGKLVSSKLGYKFEDLDDTIAKTAGMPIAEIFSRYGESYFRSLERDILNKSLQNRHQVLSLGGGTLTDIEIVNLIKKTNLLVHISPPYDVLIRRIQGKARRPLVLDNSGNPKPYDVLHEDLRPLYDKRKQLYDLAHITIETQSEWDPYHSSHQLLLKLADYGFEI